MVWVSFSKRPECSRREGILWSFQLKNGAEKVVSAPPTLLPQGILKGSQTTGCSTSLG